METKISTLESYVTQKDILNPTVSKVSVGWHIDHALITINKIYETLAASDPKQYKYSFNIVRTIMFTFGQIPRGRAKSPKVVLPPENISDHEIAKQLELAKETLKKFDTLPANAYFEHPFIGSLKRDKAKKFLNIHTLHHLKIIKDIINN